MDIADIESGAGVDIGDEETIEFNAVGREEDLVAVGLAGARPVVQATNDDRVRVAGVLDDRQASADIHAGAVEDDYVFGIDVHRRAVRGDRVRQVGRFLRRARGIERGDLEIGPFGRAARIELGDLEVRSRELHPGRIVDIARIIDLRRAVDVGLDHPRHGIDAERVADVDMLRTGADARRADVDRAQGFTR